jgi:lambda family phage portal protein
MIHLFSPLAPGQVRGVSWLAPVLLRLHDIDQYEDGQLMRQKVASLFAGFIQRDRGDDPVIAGTEQDEDGDLVAGMQPGVLQYLNPGEEIKFSEPAQVGDSVPFIELQLRSIAAGLGVPEYLLTGDLSNVNYSSIRAGMVEFRRRIEMLQYGTVIHQFCQPIWERFVTSAVLSGAIDAPDFEAKFADYIAVEWYPPAREWVDPLKDAEADALAVAAGFKSRRQVVTERGYDIERMDAEIAADKEREKSLGLDFNVKPPTSNSQDPANAAAA